MPDVAGMIDDPNLLALVATHARDMIIVTDAQQHIVWVNSAFVARTGYSAVEALGKRPGELLQGAGTDQRVRQRISVALQAGEPLRVELLNYTKGGDEYWIDMEISPVHGASGEIEYFVAVERDITEAREVTGTLSAFQQALNEQAIVSIADRAGAIRFVNDHFCAISGFSREELMGQDHRIVNSGWHSKGFFRDIWRTIVAGECWHGEICNRRKNGELYWVDTTIVPIAGNHGTPERFVSIRIDITERKAAEAQARRMAEQDDLTGLCNRRALLRAVDEALAAQGPGGQASCGLLLFLDIQDFKSVNESRGHQVGDRVLGAVARRLDELSRKVDTVARVGGNEFCLLLRDVDPSEAERTVDRIDRRLQAPFHVDGVPLALAFSFGAARYPADARDAPQLLRCAGMATRAAKAQEPSKVFFSNALQEDIEARFALQQSLRRAIAEDEFFVVFQPQVDLPGSRIRGFEVLVRWCRDGQPVPPAHFIPEAERSGLIVPLGSLVLQQAAQGYARMREAGFDPGVLSLNISAEQLRLPGLAQEIIAAARDHRIDPACLELEITETAFISQATEHVERNVRALRQHGFSVALDDFGTGFSSLTHLKRFRVDMLKIDRQFVSDLQHGGDDDEIVRSIIGLADNLGLGVVAEGVETREQAERLRSLGCVLYQGYLFGKPIGLEETLDLLADGPSAMLRPMASAG